MARELLFTCEHAGNRVPEAYASLFDGRHGVLESHRGWDPGALALARAFRGRFAAPLFYTAVTRLLVEPNRSTHHRRLFSEFTSGLDRQSKQAILQRYYHSHRGRVERWIASRVAKGRAVVHLSVHTFTPRLGGLTRNVDIGLLYDPRRRSEKQLCEAWRAALLFRQADLRVRRNYPYLGKADGFTTHLRRRFAAEQYAGIELEVNQLWTAKSSTEWLRLKRHLVQSFAAVLRSV